MEKRLASVICFCVLLSGVTVWAGTTYNAGTTYGATSDFWGDAGAWVTWDGSTPPSAADVVQINQDDNAIELPSGTTGTCAELYIANWQVPSNELVVSGGVLDVVGDAYVGYGGATGTLTFESGDINVGNVLYVSYQASGIGFINMSGGTLDITTRLDIAVYGGTGTVNLSAGTITTPEMWIGDPGLLNVTGTGQVVMPADEFDDINYYIGLGLIDGQVNLVGDNAVITAVPEPATMILLGIGGLMLRGRRS